MANCPSCGEPVTPKATKRGAPFIACPCGLLLTPRSKDKRAEFVAKYGEPAGYKALGTTTPAPAAKPAAKPAPKQEPGGKHAKTETGKPAGAPAESGAGRFYGE